MKRKKAISVIAVILAVLMITSLFASAIPLAASIALVALTALLPSITNNIDSTETISTEYVSIYSSAPTEVSSWYSSLGNSSSDDFETLEETVGFSYLTKE